MASKTVKKKILKDELFVATSYTTRTSLKSKNDSLKKSKMTQSNLETTRALSRAQENNG